MLILRLKRVSKRLGFLLMMLPILGACSNVRHVEWTEDVLLSNGRALVAKRSEENRRVLDVGAGFELGWLFQKSTITADLPAPINRSVEWQGSLKPVVLDIQPNNVVYLVGYIATVASRDQWKLPRNEFHVAFRLIENDWFRVPLAELPMSVQINLLGGTEVLFIQRGTRSGVHVDQKLKAEIASIPTLVKPLKSIVRPSAMEPNK